MEYETFEQKEKRFTERYEKEHNVWCPHCSAKIPEDDESITEMVSYHGEHEPKEITCEKCEKTFFVKEIVDRTWESSKTDSF